MLRHKTDRGRIYEAKAEAIYPLIEPGSVQLVICDGPYGEVADAEWDQIKVEDLPEWYRPHIEAWGVACAPAASVYVWGTETSASVLRPEMEANGWTWKVRITWDKGMASLAGRLDTAASRSWPDVTEVCDLYQRDALESPSGAGSLIAQAANSDPRNPASKLLREDRERAGMTRRDLAAFFPSASGGLTGCVSNWEGGQNFPTRDVWQKCAAAMQQTTPTDGRPYLVHPAVWPAPSPDHLRASYDHLRGEYDHLRGEYDHIRAEYEAQRVPFTLPPGVTNVWSDLPVAGSERLRDKHGKPLHACQKKLKHIRRMIMASSRPGDLVLEPFGGSLRVAVAIERLSPAEARRYVCVEMNKDKVKDEPVDYLGPAIEELEAARGQGHLF